MHGHHVLCAGVKGLQFASMSLPSSPARRTTGGGLRSSCASQGGFEQLTQVHSATHMYSEYCSSRRYIWPFKQVLCVARLKHFACRALVAANSTSLHPNIIRCRVPPPSLILHQRFTCARSYEFHNAYVRPSRKAPYLPSSNRPIRPHNAETYGKPGTLCCHLNPYDKPLMPPTTCAYPVCT